MKGWREEEGRGCHSGAREFGGRGRGGGSDEVSLRRWCERLRSVEGGGRVEGTRSIGSGWRVGKTVC